jgi:hypothetical protein
LNRSAHSSRFNSTVKVDRGERRAIHLEGFAAFETGETHKVLVLDLSYDGCGLQSAVELKVGQRISLAVLQKGAIEAEVRWYSDGKAGVVFKPETPSPTGRRARRSERIVLNAEVLMRRLGKSRYRVRVFDVSPEGCRVELVERPRLDERLMIKFEGLDAMEAQACWVEGSCAGLRFENPIHPAVFELMLQRWSSLSKSS